MVSPLDLLAGSTGLEPAASGVTGRRYNRLNYRPKKRLKFSSKVRWRSYCIATVPVKRVASSVGGTGLEPATSGL